MSSNPTTSHKTRGREWYEKKRYSFASVRAHVTDAMKYAPEEGAEDALKAIRNHAKQLVKDWKKDVEAGGGEESVAELAKWEFVLDCVEDAREALEHGAPEDEESDDDADHANE
jgi:hypothetical protein